MAKTKKTNRQQSILDQQDVGRAIFAMATCKQVVTLISRLNNEHLGVIRKLRRQSPAVSALVNDVDRLLNLRGHLHGGEGDSRALPLEMQILNQMAVVENLTLLTNDLDEPVLVHMRRKIRKSGSAPKGTTPFLVLLAAKRKLLEHFGKVRKK
ncbi:MAG: hypothetical protein HZA50_02540 [Planctomycetes bacterium]|nr:hypothetical protein [Planctomycetota bacterium]